MDVSRIEAISPRQIDWRKLTAKEIIKYDAQGVEVPSQYLQWAQTFLQSVEANDKDSTTYENAEGVQSSSTTSVTSVEGNSAEDKPLTAKELRESMKANGKGIIDIAKTFTDESNVRAAASKSSESYIGAIEDKSGNDMDSIESEVQRMISEIDDLKSKAESAKSKKDGFREMAQLKNQIKMYGDVAQSYLAGELGVLASYDNSLVSEIVNDSQNLDYGFETIDIGKQVPVWPTVYIRVRAFRAGANATDNSSKAIEAGSEALKTNDDNISQIYKYADEISSKTGASISSDNSQNNVNTDSKDKDNDKSQSKTQTEKVAQNDGTDTKDLASTSIDEILKRKIRQGQNLD